MTLAANSDATGFRALLIWQRGQALAELLTKEIGNLPRNRAIDAMAMQAFRSVGSVPANIAEGYGRYYKAAYRNHLSIARGSLWETESWIDLMFRSGFLSAELNSRLVRECQELSKMLTSRMKALESTPRPAVHEENEGWDV